MTNFRGILCFLLLGIASSLFAQKTVSIESARTTEYLGDMVRFVGSVTISVKDQTSTSTISADEILYDKARNTLEARGNVTFERKTGEKSSQKFTGQGLLFNIDKQEGVFLSGAMTHDSGRESSDPYQIHAEISGRDSSTTMAFKKAKLTTCDDENPHWSINASRVWILPGNEIAILNGLFFIGPLPVFYIPFFYYPSDEMIVHPVFGFRNREGYFVQTTTYLYGRKQLSTDAKESETSFANFLSGDALKEQERHGLFLKNLEEDAKEVSSDYLKLTADAYSSLGAMVGLEGSFKPKGYVTSTSFSINFGFSRTLYPAVNDTLFYSPYSPTTGDENEDSGWFFGVKLPFRYRANYSASLTKQPFQLTISLPLISDPYFKQDFNDRSEDLNWFKYLLEKDDLAEGSSISTESSYSWSISGSIKPSVAALNPWLTSLSISNLSLLMTFNSKANSDITGTDAAYSPERTFFYPLLFKPSIAFSLGGTLLSSTKATPAKETTTKETTPKETTTKETPKEVPVQSVPAKEANLGLLNPFVKDAPETPKENAEGDKSLDFFIPSGGTGLVPAVAFPSSTYSITWSLTPSFIEEVRYDAEDWDSPKDIDWNTFLSRYYQIKTTGDITGRYTYGSGIISASSALTYSGTIQRHPWLSKDSETYDTQTERDTVHLADYKASTYTIGTKETVSFAPFPTGSLFKPVSVAWNFNADLLRTEFDGTADDPTWEKEILAWDKDYINTHTAVATVGVNLGGYDQKITFTNNLPPRLESYTGAASMGWSFVSLNMDSRLYEKENAEKKWYWDPFTTKLNWKLPGNATLGQEYVYDIEEETPNRLNLTAAFGYVSAYYTMAYYVPYTLKKDEGWILDGTEKKFKPSAAGMVLSNSSKPLKLYSWKNRLYLQTTATSNVKIDLQKITESSMDLTFGLTFKVHEFLDITFSSYSKNSVIARYFQNWLDLPEELPGERNIFKDLLMSYNFFNMQDRYDSGFKLKNLNFSLTHYLHDWTLSLTTAVSPKLVATETSYTYEFIPSVTFMVQWKPISDIRTKVTSKDGEFTLNTTDDEDEDD